MNLLDEWEADLAKMMMRAGLLSVSALALIACSGGGDGDVKSGKAATGKKASATQVKTRARKEKNVRIFNRSLGEPEFLDPGLITESEGGVITHDTFEGLYQYGPTHTDWPPGVAMSHTISEDGRTYTFKLRQNAKWSDGKSLNAHDFEWSWKRVMDPATGSRYAGIMWFIKGARAYSSYKTPEGLDPAKVAEQKQALRDAVGVKATDDYTLQVTLEGPTPFFIQLTAFYSFAPVPKHVIEKYGDKWSRPENIVSNGPWHTTEWKSHQRIIAKINEHYWDKANIPFDQINYKITQESDPAHNMYLGGDLDYLESKVPPSMLPKYRKEKHPELKVSPYLGVYYYGFNTSKKPFDDVRVRKALNLAIDKTKIGRFVVKGGQEEALSIVHPILKDMGYVPAEGPEFDPDQAQKLLAEAGFPKGKGFPNFQISYNTQEGHKLVAEYIQQQWKKNLGVSCDLDNMEWKVLLKKRKAGDFMISRLAWIGDYFDPMTFLEIWEGDNPNNHTRWKNATFDQYIDAARKEPDAKARLATLRKAEELYIAEVPSIPIYFYVKHDMVKPWLKGYHTHIQGVHPSRWFKIQP